MNGTIKVICGNGFGELEVPMGTPLLEVAERLTPGLHPFLAAFVNNRIKELSYKIYALWNAKKIKDPKRDCRVEVLDWCW